MDLIVSPWWWLGVLVALFPVAPLVVSAGEFLTAGIWSPVYGIYSPPVWLYDMATMIGTI